MRVDCMRCSLTSLDREYMTPESLFVYCFNIQGLPSDYVGHL